MKPRRATPVSQAQGEVPVDLPLVQMLVRDDGTMSVLSGSAPYLPPAHAPAWRRESYSAILDAITAALGTPVKVVVTECDSTVYTDVVFPRRQAPTPPPQTAAPAPASASRRALPLVQVTGDGFIPGEEVAVAPILAHCGAAPDGRVNALVPQGHVSDVQELALVGRISGTIQVVRAVR